MKVRFARSAEADLEAIGDWIADQNPRRAITFVGELRARCISLSQQPNRFPSVGRVAGHPLRKLSHGNYHIFYLVSTDRVNIVRITHGSRDWSALLVDLQ